MAWKGFVNYSGEERQFSLPGAGGPAYDFADHVVSRANLINLSIVIFTPCLSTLSIPRNGHDAAFIGDQRGP
jgi:hypothetical protein